MDATLLLIDELLTACEVSTLTDTTVEIAHAPSPYAGFTLKQLQSAYRDRGFKPGKLRKQALFALLDSLPPLPVKRKRRKGGRKSAA